MINKKRRRVLPVLPAGEKGLGESQLTKRFYCYCKWMSASRRFSSGASFFPGPGPRIAPGAMGGSGGMGSWRFISMGLPARFFCADIAVLTAS
jgi:hypothetical protein